MEEMSYYMEKSGDGVRGGEDPIRIRISRHGDTYTVIQERSVPGGEPREEWSRSFEDRGAAINAAIIRAVLCGRPEIWSIFDFTREEIVLILSAGLYFSTPSVSILPLQKLPLQEEESK